MQKKSIILVLFIVSISFIAQAQSGGHLSFGLRGGINFQNINGKDDNGDKMSNMIVPKFHIGANVEIPIATDFYVQPGLMFITKGAKDKTDATGFSPAETDKINISYIELPINLLYKPVLGRGKLLLGFGPYIGYGIGGKLKRETSVETITEDVKFKNNVKLTDPDDKFYVKPIDAGANILFGYELSNKLSAQLNAQLGLTKINPSSEGSTNKASAKNTGFGLSIGYRFN
jgi:Outer membrane protein beta-barrel domain